MENPFATIENRLSGIENILLDLKEKSEKHDFSPDERLTREQVCSLYKISLPTLHTIMKKGLPFEKVGRKTLFRRQDIDEYFRK